MTAPANVAALKALQADAPGRYTHSQQYANFTSGVVFAVPARAFMGGTEAEDLVVKLLGDTTFTTIRIMAGQGLVENMSIVEVQADCTATRITFFW
jgi:hypothetical protein